MTKRLTAFIFCPFLLKRIQGSKKETLPSKNKKKIKLAKKCYHFPDGFEHVIFIAFSSPLTEETRYLWAFSVYSARIMPEKILRTKKS